MSSQISSTQQFPASCWLEFGCLPNDTHPWYTEFRDRVQQQVRNRRTNLPAIYPDCLIFTDDNNHSDRNVLFLECVKAYGGLEASKKMQKNDAGVCELFCSHFFLHF